MIEKKIKFDSKDWLVRIEGLHIQVFKMNDDGTVDRNLMYGGGLTHNNLVDDCKYAVLKANQSYSQVHNIDLFNLWDGDMDKWLQEPDTNEIINNIIRR